MNNSSEFDLKDGSLTLNDLQAYVRALVAARGWTSDPNQIFVLLNEEVGEVAKEIRRSWKVGVPSVNREVGAELVDVLMYVLDLANVLNVNLEDALRAKMAFNKTRTVFGA